MKLMLADINSKVLHVKNNVHNLENLCKINLIISVYLDGTMITHIGKIGPQKNCCHLKNMGHIDLILASLS